MRTLLSTTFWLIASLYLIAQSILPVRENGRWGVINESGRLLIAPQYDQLGWPGAGSAIVVQQGDRLGLLAPDGREILAPRYEDIQLIDEQLFGVLEDGRWSVRNLSGRVVVASGYDQLDPLGQDLIAYRRNRLWGVVRSDGLEVAPAAYNRIELRNNQYLLVEKDRRQGLIDLNGHQLLATVAEAIEVDSSLSLILYQRSNRWGGQKLDGSPAFSADYSRVAPLDDYHLLLIGDDQLSVYHHASERAKKLPHSTRPMSFSDGAVALQQGHKVGLLFTEDEGVLYPDYQELQPFNRQLVRAARSGRWGLINRQGTAVQGFSFDYISPLSSGVAICYAAGRAGLLDRNGRLLLPTDYARIEQEGRLVRAFLDDTNGSAMETYRLDEQGQLQLSGGSSQHFNIRVSGHTDRAANPSSDTRADRVLARFEWFYAAESNRWGLRERGGQELIAPTFSRIEVEPELGITLVGLPKNSDLVFERTSYRAQEVFGLMLNAEGKVVTEFNLLHLELDDWRAGHALARCVFDNGRYGLIDRSGQVVLRDAAYIGAYYSGLAAVSLQGRLSGRMDNETRSQLPLLADELRRWATQVSLVDYTAYDQQFASRAQLTCEGCRWGYVNEAGQMAISPRFEDFAGRFRADRAIVAQGQEVGLIDRRGEWVLPPAYSSIVPMNGEDGQYRYLLSQKINQTGLIDTLGEVVVPARYQQIGQVSEGWLAVSTDEQQWQQLSIAENRLLPIEALALRPFRDGKAVVRLSDGWTLIDQEGTRIWGDRRYEQMSQLGQGLVWAKSGGHWALMDTAGHTLFRSTDIKNVHAFEGRVARVQTTFGWGLVDPSGQWTVRPRFVQIDPFQENGLARVRVSIAPQRYGLIDQSGRMLTSKGYKEMADFSDGLALVQDQNGYGFINQAGQEVIPCTLGPTRSFSEGLAVFQEFGQCGYIDKQGNAVVPAQYSGCQDFNEGLAVVYKTMSQAGLIDRSGREVVAPSLNRLLRFQEGRGLVKDQQKGYFFVAGNASLYDGYYDYAEPYRHGVAIVGLGDRVGLLNHKGISLIRPKYASISAFQDGYATIRQDRRYGLADQSGHLILPVQYDYLAPAGADIWRVEESNKLGYMASNGSWIWPLKE